MVAVQGMECGKQEPAWERSTGRGGQLGPGSPRARRSPGARPLQRTPPQPWGLSSEFCLCGCQSKAPPTQALNSCRAREAGGGGREAQGGMQGEACARPTPTLLRHLAGCPRRYRRPRRTAAWCLPPPPWPTSIMLFSGGRPTQARNTFSSIARCLARAFTTGVPEGTSGACAGGAGGVRADQVAAGGWQALQWSQHAVGRAVHAAPQACEGRRRADPRQRLQAGPPGDRAIKLPPPPPW